MIYAPLRSGDGTAALVDRLARKFVADHGDRARDALVSVIEMLIEDGDLEMARMWTRVMHASARLTATFPIHGAPRH